MMLISILIFTILQFVAIIHIGWAFGMSWPAQDRAALVQTVVGQPEGVSMPGARLTFAVAICISLLGMLALWGAGWFSLQRLDAFKIWPLLAAASVFGLRGVATYLPIGPLANAVAPFRKLDLHYFAPVCLLLAIGFAALAGSL